MVELGIADGVVVDWPRLVLPRRVRAGLAGVVTSAGAGPASAGVVTVGPVMAAFCRERRELPGVNEHRIVLPGTDVSVKRLPEWRARNETICGEPLMFIPLIPLVPLTVVPVGVVVVVVVPAVVVPAGLVPVAVVPVMPVMLVVPAPTSPVCSATAV